MLTFEIPGRRTLHIEHLVFDFNGTIAVDGSILPEVRELLPALAEKVRLYVLTADTYGTVKRECEGLPVEVKTFPREHAAECKLEIVQALGGQTACVGNGYNDILMCDAADLSIAVITEETMCAALLTHADVFAPTVRSALELFLKPDRLAATLRS